MGYEWFPAFDAIPGVEWQPLTPVDRLSVPGIDARPRVETLTLGGGDFDRVEWLTATGERLYDESGSPAVQLSRELASEGDLVPLTIAEKISAILAVPGTRGDYHFGMLSARGALKTARRVDPRVFGWIEALCLADISLMEQGPQLVFSESHWGDLAERAQLAHPAFAELSSLYQHEGFLAAAVDIEKRLSALGASRSLGVEAATRQLALLEEDGR